MPSNSRGLRNHKAKCFVLVLYLTVTVATPFAGHVPIVRDYIKRHGESYIPQSIDPFFQHYIQTLKTSDSKQTLSLMTPSAPRQVATSTLHEITSLLASTTGQMQGIAFHMNAVTGQGTFYEATYEAKTTDPEYKYLRADFFAEDNGSGMKVDSVHFTQEMHSITDLGPYDAARQTSLWIAAFALPLFIAYTGFRYIRKAQKPHWGLFLIILFASFYVILLYRSGNITGGLNIGILSATYKNSFGYYYMIPIPLGTLYYWFAKRRYEVHQ